MATSLLFLFGLMTTMLDVNSNIENIEFLIDVDNTLLDNRNKENDGLLQALKQIGVKKINFFTTFDVSRYEEFENRPKLVEYIKQHYNIEVQHVIFNLSYIFNTVVSALVKGYIHKPDEELTDTMVQSFETKLNKLAGSSSISNTNHSQNISNQPYNMIIKYLTSQYNDDDTYYTSSKYKLMRTVRDFANKETKKFNEQYKEDKNNTTVEITKRNFTDKIQMLEYAKRIMPGKKFIIIDDKKNILEGCEDYASNKDLKIATIHNESTKKGTQNYVYNRESSFYLLKLKESIRELNSSSNED